MNLEIVEVGPADRDLFAAWHGAYVAADGFGRNDPPTWQLEERRAQLTSVNRAREAHAYAGLVEGRVVASGWLELPQLDNTYRAEIEVHVLPEVRRRGHGSALLEHLEHTVRWCAATIAVTDSGWQ